MSKKKLNNEPQQTISQFIAQSWNNFKQEIRFGLVLPYNFKSSVQLSSEKKRKLQEPQNQRSDLTELVRATTSELKLPKFYQHQCLAYQDIIDTLQLHEETQQLFMREGFQFVQEKANQPCQDSICFFQIPKLQGSFVVSVYDGHGGPELAQYCKKHTKICFLTYFQSLRKQQKRQEDTLQMIKKTLKHTYLRLQENFYRDILEKKKNTDKKIKNVGTCAITFVIFKNNIIVATAGDSQAIVLSNQKGKYSYQNLCERFSANNKAQRQRLQNQFKGKDQNIVIKARKNTYYLKGVLQPTKSIGDYYLKKKQMYFGNDQYHGPYLTSQPHINVYNIKNDDKYLLIASDGLWDYMGKWQILRQVMQHGKKKNDTGSAQQETEQQSCTAQMKKHSSSIGNVLVDRIIQKVADQNDVSTDFIYQLTTGDRRKYHDDITIGIVNLEKFFQSLQKQQK